VSSAIFEMTGRLFPASVDRELRSGAQQLLMLAAKNFCFSCGIIDAWTKKEVLEVLAV
jgi:hypothetical protein